MSNNKDKKPNSGLTYPPAAHIRTPRNPNIAVQYPKPPNKDEDSGKTNSLEWLKEADSYEASNKEKGQPPNVEGKTKDSGETSSSLNWLVEAANYEPLKEPPKNNKD